ncbi:MAG TPA: cohesin domain-containing protein, partial [Pyrinomonadaceae bacterium]|nr:cohesin domain-containing protein [Pyrinomonadaceae bacterium]
AAAPAAKEAAQTQTTPAALPVVNNATVAAAVNNAATASGVAAGSAQLTLVPDGGDVKPGERRRLTLALKTDSPLGLVAATLRFDPKVVAVRAVSTAVPADGSAAPVVTHSVDPSGVLVISAAPGAGARPFGGESLLLVVEVQGLAAGESDFAFDADKVHLIAADGRAVRAASPAAAVRLKVVE